MNLHPGSVPDPGLGSRQRQRAEVCAGAADVWLGSDPKLWLVGCIRLRAQSSGVGC